MQNNVSNTKARKRQQTSVMPYGARWYIGAVLIQLASVAVFSWIGPSKEATTTAARKTAARDSKAAARATAATMPAEEVRRVSQSVERATTGQLAQQLKRLETMRGEMAKLEAQRLDALRKTTQTLQQDPNAALEAMRRAQAEMKSNATTMQAADQQTTTSPSLDAIDAALADAMSKMPVLDEKYRPVVSSLDRVQTLQERARQAWSAGTANKDNDKANDAVREAEKLANDLAQKVRSAEQKEAQVTERAKLVEEIKQQIADLTRQRDATTDEKARTKAESKLANQGKRLAEKQRSLEQYTAQAKAYRAALAPRQERVAQATAASAGAANKQAASKNEAQELQLQAAGAQDETVALMEKTLSGNAAPLQKTDEDFNAMTTEQLYAAARKREREITDSYKTWRASELAMLSQMPLGQALRQTDVVRPERPPLDAQASEAVGSAASLERRKEKLEAALRETNSMVSLGESLLGMAQRRADAETNGYAAALDNARARMQEQTRLASVDVSGRVADLTGTGGVGAGSGAPGGGQGAGAGMGTGNGSGAGAGMGSGVGSGMGNGNGTGADGGSGMGGSGHPGGGSKLGITPPQEVGVGEVKKFGRKLVAQGDAAKWLGIDTWYVIGPFPNPGRDNIDRQFPPESAIDLDAAYIGKANRILHWQFQQASRVEVVPRSEESYGIWYATTEVMSDAPRDVWLAMGSDDKGQLWLNGQLAWISSSKHKDWTIGEALRRVHLKAGRNVVLYRIENGHGGMGFSLCLALGD